MTHRRTTEVTPAADGSGGGSAAQPNRRAEPQPAAGLPHISPDHAATVHRLVVDWFQENARPLPWRDPEASAWSILVCEVMSQQTPVSRVLPRWSDWMERWPTPADLAAAPASDVLIAWDSLGYPRRALRLQETAAAIVERHDSIVPDDEATLRTLPGVGAYTAAAVTSFAYGRHAVVLDVNVRRVLGRVFAGVEHRPASLTAAERRWASALVPDREHVVWNAGTMELGALVCTARNPDCAACPLLEHCAWVAAGKPSDPTVARRTQAWAGTDRQLRGAIMRVVRTAYGSAPVPLRFLTAPTAHLTAAEADALSALPAPLQTAVSAVRELDAGGERTARLADDLVRDGLAVSTENGLRLP
ncbi:A/G-specific adenine glycosylase [Brevibacterium yomogidense]|uniref:A/G-specific adenine glycosylase n=1 Tax=Brevibacterium yomogidense TaxID=946573 RepID=UPI0018DF4F1B|nr:A/G-specific adenine glycosylase [Brevibacterium yomogidense]